MRILIIGGGGREHVLAWKLAQSLQVKKIFCIPGNAGIAKIAECVEGDVEDIPALAEFARENRVDLTVVGPEAPLVAGIVDHFRDNGLLILGPEKEAALLEGSKVWAKEFMASCNIPTAAFKVFTELEDAKKYVYDCGTPLVIKADGLAAGKGVFVTVTPEEADAALRQIMADRVFGEAGNKVVIEEKLKGEEVSLLALTDGDKFLTLPSAQDHKAAKEGDTGPNTGGMGAYSPAPVMTDEIKKFAEDYIFQPLIKGMKEKDLVYRGIIYAGLMITEEGPQVLEFNVRFGDPEAQVIIPRFDADIAPLLFNAANGDLRGDWQWKEDAAVCVVMASGGYPGSYEKGKVISGLAEAESEPDTVVYHAGTKSADDGNILTSGGRVLGITSRDKDLRMAVDKAYAAAGKINFNGAYYRRDIAHRAFKH